MSRQSSVDSYYSEQNRDTQLQKRYTKKEYPKSPTCYKTNHRAELCWKGAGAHLKPKSLKLEGSKTDEASTSNNDAQNKQITNNK